MELYSTLFCSTDSNKNIAVDYRLQNNSLEKFLERDAYYQGENLIRIYILGVRQDKEKKQLDWYQNLIQNAMGYVALLDTDRERLILKKSFSYRIGKQRKFKLCKMSYPIKELGVKPDGRMVCDFGLECENIERMIQEEKEQYRIEQERVRIHLEREKERYRHNHLEQEKNRNQHELEQNQSHLEEDLERNLLEQNAERLLLKQGMERYGLQDLNLEILLKCRRMIKEGNGHLVSKKYYDAVISIDEIKDDGK